jgi:hypothetical protein
MFSQQITFSEFGYEFGDFCPSLSGHTVARQAMLLLLRLRCCLSAPIVRKPCVDPHAHSALRPVYTKHELRVVQPNLCRTTKIEALQFVSYDRILCRAAKFRVSCKRTFKPTRF